MLQMFYFFRILPLPISVLSARMTWLTMKEFLKPKPNEKFTGRVFFKLLKLVKRKKNLYLCHVLLVVDLFDDGKKKV